MNIKILNYPMPSYSITHYSRNLYHDILQYEKDHDLLDNVVYVDVPKIEFKLRSKQYGGFISSEIIGKFIRKADIIHSTSKIAVVKNTNVITIHDLINLEKQKELHISDKIVKNQMKQLERIKKTNVKRIVVPSPHVVEEVKKYLDYPVDVITSKVFVGKPDENPYPDDGKIHLITVGEIHKGIQRKQINELYQWLKGNEEIDLYHIGRIEDRRYLGLTTEGKYHRYAKNIHSLGFVSDQTKTNYLAYADKFVYKSVSEGQGLPAMEAMKLNTQVIVNDIIDHREMMGDKAYYYNNKDEFMEMIHKPKKSGLVEQITQYDNWIEKYMKVYNEVANDNNK